MFGKPRCSLCDHAKQALVSAGVEFDEVDITADPALQAELGSFIPVVEVGGVTVFEAGMDPGQLPELVSEAQAGPSA